MTRTTDTAFTTGTSWVGFWNETNSIYANPRHLEAHYTEVAQCVIRAAGASRVVMDYGCGDALASDHVAAHFKHLYLFDAAPQKQRQLQDRFAKVGNLTVLDEAALAALPAAGIDCVVINSVFQYLSLDQAQSVLTSFHRVLAPGARVVVADIIPPGLGIVKDVVALLKFGWDEGFFWAAVGSLGKTLFSEYTVMRKQLGLQFYTEQDFMQLAQSAGYQATRYYPNFGHNQSRMAFDLRVAP